MNHLHLYQMDKQATLFIEYKSLLFSIAYNMLGSVDTAEDIVQDAFLKWMDADEAAVKHPKAYLGKIVTNSCINYLHSARVQREAYMGIWLPEPLHYNSIDTGAERIEMYHALSLGLLVLMEKLNPQERAIFLLREIFAYDYTELSDIFDKSPDNCRQILKRAKEHLGKDARRFQVDMKVHEKMLQRLVQASSEGNMEELIGLLKEDIVLYADGGGKVFNVNGQRLTAPPRPIHGREKISRLMVSALHKLQDMPGLHRELTIVNGLPSIITWSGDTAMSVFSMECEDGLVKNIYIQTNPHKLKHLTPPHNF